MITYFCVILGRKKGKSQVFSGSPPGSPAGHQRGDTSWQTFSSTCSPTSILLLVWCSTGSESRMVPDLHMSQLHSDKKRELNFAVQSCGKQTALKIIKSNQSKSLIPVVARKMQQTQQFKTFAPLESVQKMIGLY